MGELIGEGFLMKDDEEGVDERVGEKAIVKPSWEGRILGGVLVGGSEAEVLIAIVRDNENKEDDVMQADGD